MGRAIGWRVVFVAILAGPTGCQSGGGVQFVRGTDVVPGEASHADYRPPRWLGPHP